MWKLGYVMFFFLKVFEVNEQQADQNQDSRTVINLESSQISILQLLFKADSPQKQELQS